MDKQIKQFKQNQEYRKGAIMLARIQPGGNPWDDAASAYFLRKSDRIPAALQVCRTAYPLSKENEWFQREYAFAIYQSINWSKDSTKELVHGLKALAKLNAPDWILVKAGYATTKALYKDGHYQAALQVANGLHDTQMEPEMRRWLHLMILKLQIAIEDYDRVLSETEKEARKVPPDPFALRIRAKALLKKEKKQEALDLYLNRILPVKDDWYLFFEAAVLMDKNGEKRRAAAFLALALLKPGPDKMKIKAMDSLSDILDSLTFPESDYFRRIACAIRTREGWKIPQQSQKAFGCQGENTHLDKKKATEIFLEFAPAKTGKVATTGGNNSFCFVKSGTDSFFCNKKSLIGGKSMPKTGETVQFMEMTGFDYKKKKFSTQCIILLAE